MQNDSTAEFYFSITSESILDLLSLNSIYLYTLGVQTYTFPLLSDYFTLNKNRSFFVSVSDGLIIKETRAALLNQQSLHWSEILDGL